VFETIKQVLLDGESVNIPGMCTLYPKYQDYGDQGKVWRNPHNGEVTTIHSKVQLRCRPTRAFQNKMTERLIDG
jgi:nucleoid DNA-binding protein